MSEVKPQMKWYEMLACLWPIALVSIGGGIGGLLGGLACGLNFHIFTKDISTFKKYSLTTLTGITAIALYIAAAVLATS